MPGLDVPPAPRSEILLERVLASPVTLVIGESDTGKTTLVRDLANGLVRRGMTVGIVDADLGQSEIGPPTTIGLGRVTAPMARLGDAEVLALRFVGVTSAAREPLATVAATTRLVDRARDAGLARIVIDTCGLVRGYLGRRLKHATIEAIDPDLVIVLERQTECAAIVDPYRRSTRPLIVRAAAVGPARARSPETRHGHRARALAAHFQGARALALDLSRIVLRSPLLFTGDRLMPSDLSETEHLVGGVLVWGERRGDEVTIVSRDPLDDRESRVLARAFRATVLDHYAVTEIEGMLAGLEDEAGETLGLGVVQQVDFAEASLRVTTPVREERIVSIAIGRERYEAGRDPTLAGPTG
jgi:polynucleotide 5'-hydroxyl-kinase GRC3/NOL9